MKNNNYFVVTQDIKYRASKGLLTNSERQAMKKKKYCGIENT